MPNKKEELIEEFKQGFYSSVAPDDWSDENVEGYKAAQRDIEPWLSTALDTHATNEVRRVVEKIKVNIEEYKQFCSSSRNENLEKEQIMLAYDMDSRWVATKHIANRIEALTQEPLTVNKEI